MPRTLPVPVANTARQPSSCFSLNPKYRPLGGPRHLTGVGVPGETQLPFQAAS